jgi:hypothetical protein
VRGYRDVWLTATAVVLVLGVWVAMAELTPAAATALFVAAGLLGGCSALVLHGGERGAPQLAMEALVTGAAVLALCGYGAVLGAAAWLPLVAPVVSCPWVIGHALRVARRWSTCSSPAPHGSSLEAVLTGVGEIDPVAMPHRPAPTAMNVEELCWAWRRSYVRLQSCRTVAEVVQVVAERQQCLDEMERRNPGGLSAWLESGARAAGDPTRYVTPDDPNGCQDDAA